MPVILRLQHTLAREEAEKWRTWRDKNLKKRQDCERVLRVGESELANALDAAGQVYTLGTGASNCMLGRPIPSKCVPVLRCPRPSTWSLTSTRAVWRMHDPLTSRRGLHVCVRQRG